MLISIKYCPNASTNVHMVPLTKIMRTTICENLAHLYSCSHNCIYYLFAQNIIANDIFGDRFSFVVFVHSHNSKY